MEDQKKHQKKPKSKRLKKKLIGILFAIPLLGIILFIGLYAYITSEGFFQNKILPQISSQLGGVIEVGNSRINPLSQVKLAQLKVQSSDKTQELPVLQIKELDIRYDALKLLFGGELLVKKVLVESPVIYLKRYKNKSADAIFKPAPKDPDTEPIDSGSPSQPANIPQVLIQNVNISNASITIETEQEDNSWATQKVAGFNFTIDQLGNGKKGKMQISSTLSSSKGEDKVLAALAGRLDMEFSQKLTPVNLIGDITVGVNEAAGALSELADVSASFQVAFKPGSLEKFDLVVSRSENVLAKIAGNGPVNTKEGTADLSLSANNINKSVLNLFAISSGGDFGTTNLSLDLQYKAQNQFKQHQFNGSVTGQSIQWRTNEGSIPTVDLSLSIQSSYDAIKKLALIPEFNITMSEAGENFVDVNLNKPLSVDISGEKPIISNTQFSLNLKDFDLAKWSNSEDPQSGLSGMVQSTLHISSQSNGDDLQANLSSSLTGFSTGDKESPFYNSSIFINVNGAIQEFADFSAEDIGFRIDGNEGSLLAMQARGGFSADGELSLTSTTDLVNNKDLDLSEKLGLEIKSSIKPDKVDIESINLSLKSSEKVPMNSLSISGVLPGHENPDMKGNLDVVSEGLDLTRLNGFITSLSSQENKEEKDEPKEDKEESEPDAITLPFKHLVTKLKIDKLVYDKMTADNVELIKTIKDGKIDVNPLRFDILGMPINSKFSADVSVPGYEYSGKVDFSDLPLASLMTSFGQKVDPSKHTGQLDFALGFSGKGLTSDSIKNNFKANTQLDMGGGNLAITGGFRKFVILPIATVLRIDPMLDGVVNQINLDAEYGSNNLNIKKARVATEPFEISADGTVSIQENLKKNTFKLPLTVSLRRDIAESANFLPKNTPESQKYVPMPDFVQLVGKSFSEVPKVNINEKQIAQMLLKSAAGLPGEALENATEIIQNPAGAAKDIIKGVGGLIPGVGPESESIEKNKKSRTPGSIIKGLFE